MADAGGTAPAAAARVSTGGGAATGDGGGGGGKKAGKDRRLQYKTALRGDATQKRVQAAAATRASDRKSRLKAKRVKVDPADAAASAAAASAAEASGGDAAGAAAAAAAAARLTFADFPRATLEAAVATVRSTGAAMDERVAAMKCLRQAVSVFDDHSDRTLIADVLSLGVGDLLSAVLAAPAAVNDENLKAEAAWCVANVATGTSEETSAVLPTAPHLIAMLSPLAPRNLTEQAVWALANLAGDRAEIRVFLTNNGAVEPLVRLLKEGDAEIVSKAAWCIGNLLRGEDMSALPWVTAGVAEPVLAHVAAKSDESVVTECCWVLSFLTARELEVTPPLLEAGMLEALQPVLASGVASAITPALRVFGNVTADNVAHIDRALAVPGFLETLSSFLVADQAGALVHEALWVASNVAAGSPSHAAALVASGCIAQAAHHILNSPFHIRKWAAFVLSHFAYNELDDGGKAYLRELASIDLVDQFVKLLSVPDVGVVVQAMNFLEVVMMTMPDTGPRMVEAADGIAALERVAEITRDAALEARAYKLVDSYFGEDYGVDDAAEAGAADGAGAGAGAGGTLPFGVSGAETVTPSVGRGRGRGAVLPHWADPARGGGAPGTVPGVSAAAIPGAAGALGSSEPGGAQPTLEAFGFARAPPG